MKRIKGGEPIGLSIFLWIMTSRITEDIRDTDLPKYITELLVLLLRELNIDETPRGKEELRRIVNMTDKDRDSIFYNFIYSEDISPNDVRFMIKEIYNKIEEVQKIIPKVLESIQEVDVYILREELELYNRLFEQFCEYLFLEKNRISDQPFEYNIHGQRVYTLEGKRGKKQRRKQRKTVILKSCSACSVRNTRKKSSKKVRPHSI